MAVAVKGAVPTAELLAVAALTEEKHANSPAW
jgi:hypothetical protein